MPTCIIDGKEVAFEEGESIIVAATRESIEIPYYCWHPRLSVAANCRMCLVEVEGAPKLTPACQTPCRADMVVSTTNDKVKDAQRAVHEFLLVNHPIDCPICDQAGECKLQDYYMQYHKTQSRRRDARVRKHKVEAIGPHVIYDAERCIVCTRCVRFMDEVAKDPCLGIFQRGEHSVIGVAPGASLNSAYSLNTVDVCPVGALTSAEFRFKQRVWNLQRESSVCGGCARGCNIHVESRAGQVYRFLPRENEQVNASWMCDDGRLSYRKANQQRWSYPLLRGTEGVQITNPATALQAIRKILEAPARGDVSLAAALSLYSTCEEAFVFGCVLRDIFGIEYVGVLEYGAWQEDHLLRVADRNPNRAGILRVMSGLGLEVVSQQALAEQLAKKPPAVLLTIGEEASDLESFAQKVQTVPAIIHLGTRKSPLSDVAHVVLPGLSWLQIAGTWVNVDGRAQALVPCIAADGAARPYHAWLLDIARLFQDGYAWQSVASVQAQMQQALPSFADVSLQRLGETGHLIHSP